MVTAHTIRQRRIDAERHQQIVDALQAIGAALDPASVDIEMSDTARAAFVRLREHLEGQRMGDAPPMRDGEPEENPGLFLGAMSLSHEGMPADRDKAPTDESRRYVPARICSICNKDLPGHKQEVEADPGSGHAFRSVENVSEIKFDIPRS